MMRAQFVLFLSLIFSSVSVFAQEIDEIRRMRSFTNPIVKVSSVLWDLGQRKAKRVTGVGTIVRSLKTESRRDYIYYVLTAGHVAMGVDLVVTTADHQQLKIKKAHHDPTFDVSLLELESSQDLKSPLVSLAHEMEGVQAALLSFLSASSRPEVRRARTEPGGYLTRFSELEWSEAQQSGTVRMKNSNFEFPVIRIDSGSRRDLSDPNQSWQRPSLVVQAPWLPKLKRKNTPSAQVEPLSRSFGIESYEIASHFPRGYSGSPILIAHGGEESFYLYILSGILTTSSLSSDSAQTKSVGPRVLYRLMLGVQSGTIDENRAFLPTWALINDSFIRIQNQIEVFLYSGPIGNGIVVDGRNVDQASVAQARYQTEKSILVRGLTSKHTAELTFKVARFKSENQTQVRAGNSRNESNADRLRNEQFEIGSTKVRIR